MSFFGVVFSFRFMVSFFSCAFGVAFSRISTSLTKSRGKCHIPFKFIEGIYRAQFLMDANLEHIVVGNQLPKKKKCKDHAARLQKRVKRCLSTNSTDREESDKSDGDGEGGEGNSILDYLRRLAHNITFH
jgi:hypothetical protein